MAQNHSQTTRSRQTTTNDTSVRGRQPTTESMVDKYHKLKRKYKDIQQVADTVRNDLERAKKRIRSLKREKDLLLERLTKFDDSEDDSLISSDNSIPASEIESSETEISSIASSRASSQRPSSTASSHLTIKKSRSRTPSSQPAGKRPNITTNIIPVPPPVVTKPKRASKRPVSTKTMKVQHVEKDENGQYKLPVQIGILTVLHLGTVVWDRNTFHNERYIWPVGYAVKRMYNSMINPDAQTMYTCKIEDGGESPRFVIEAEDQQGKPIIANTATGAWTTVVREANSIRHRDHSNSASGPDYFGFSQATIRKMIQDLPNARKCKNYVVQNFEVMKTRNGGRRRGVGKVNGVANGVKAEEGKGENGIGNGDGIAESGRVSSVSSPDGDIVMSEGEEESPE
ncbi:8744_t:CDS:2 [Paraglomus occultum]|uniref:8744_t:CDS:1 n=1 Tax=Paraglomus occultum TaxID=144539 RepID=A0A9N8ZVT4_9GLOM|nr:8744_t:CDS:2 [Paraglomus occultum]